MPSSAAWSRGTTSGSVRLLRLKDGSKASLRCRLALSSRRSCVLGHVCFVGLLGCVNRRRAVSPGAERLSAHACAQVHGGVFVPHDQVHESLAFTRLVRAGRPHSRWHDKPTTSPWSHSGGKCIPAILSRCDVRDDELSVANLMLPTPPRSLAGCLLDANAPI